jgi:hypothetical protein
LPTRFTIRGGARSTRPALHKKLIGPGPGRRDFVNRGGCDYDEYWRNIIRGTVAAWESPREARKNETHQPP